MNMVIIQPISGIISILLQIKIYSDKISDDVVKL